MQYLNSKNLPNADIEKNIAEESWHPIESYYQTIKSEILLCRYIGFLRKNPDSITEPSRVAHSLRYLCLSVRTHSERHRFDGIFQKNEEGLFFVFKRKTTRPTTSCSPVRSSCSHFYCRSALPVHDCTCQKQCNFVLGKENDSNQIKNVIKLLFFSNFFQ